MIICDQSGSLNSYPPYFSLDSAQAAPAGVGRGVEVSESVLPEKYTSDYLLCIRQRIDSHGPSAKYVGAEFHSADDMSIQPSSTSALLRTTITSTTKGYTYSCIFL